jgi:hypothetical protein
MWGTRFIFVAVMFFNSLSYGMIYGPDERQPLTMEYAAKVGLRPVVYLLMKKPAGLLPCTGTWISDTLILTARHCAADVTNILVINQYQGYLGDSRALAKRIFVDSSSSDNSADWYERRGLNLDSRANSKDWAVIEVYKEAGGEPRTIINQSGQVAKNLERYGDGATMGALPIGDSRILNEHPGIELAAYHTDANDTLYRQFCRYRPRTLTDEYWQMNWQGIIEVDCDTAESASGAAILKCDGKSCYIVGVYSGGFQNEQNHMDEYDGARHGNRAVPSINFMKQVNEIIQKNYSHVKQFSLGKPKCKLTACID